MRYLVPIFFLFIGFTSCNDFSEQNEESIKINQKRDAVFKSISKKWLFVFPENTNSEIKETISNWNEWQQFKRELEEKPKTSLLAFQMKVKNVSKKSDSLSLTVPENFNIPQVRSRLVTLNTKIKSLDTYIHLGEIPEKRILTLITEINEEIKGVYTQWDEVVTKKAIPKEIGEDDMIRALDTTRLANKKFQDEIIENENKPKPELEE
ncbi:hypothetical protein LXD69_05885 [Flavobacterium sediminilitoris]|uniref:Lipoprotein n=1 Tax=Flavobacterium sediminilitoris TaxID=2024526 RepID=A0ABY4HS57_9FLAO|nr:MULTISPECIES: hypothetical protein [Flavobacterium]UOX35041.1 hypothetical protein LXD69_05885 [Flavobacterium sediminilitoris]